MHWDHEPSVCQKRAIASPSPWGEGRGEGEGTVRQPTVFDPANRLLQPTFHGEKVGAKGTAINVNPQLNR